MPPYGTNGWPVAIQPGDQVELVTAADTSAGTLVKSVSVALSRTAASTRGIVGINSTNQSAQIAIAAQDQDANYLPAVSLIVPAGASLAFTAVGILRVQFLAAPSSGSFWIIG